MQPPPPPPPPGVVTMCSILTRHLTLKHAHKLMSCLPVGMAASQLLVAAGPCCCTCWSLPCCSPLGPCCNTLGPCLSSVLASLRPPSCSRSACRAWRPSPSVAAREEWHKINHSTHGTRVMFITSLFSTPTRLPTRTCHLLPYVLKLTKRLKLMRQCKYRITVFTFSHRLSLFENLWANL